MNTNVPNTYVYVCFNNNVLAVPLTASSQDALISSIRTVFVSIALPALWHALVRSWTLEGLRTAGHGLCDDGVQGKREHLHHANTKKKVF